MLSQLPAPEGGNGEVPEEYIHWLQQLKANGVSIYKLSEQELEYLIKYVEHNTGRGKVFANNILCVLYEICIEKDAESEKQKAKCVGYFRLIFRTLFC